MRNVRAIALIAALAGYGAASFSPLPFTEAQEKTAKKAPTEKKAGGRLPANFGQIGLSEEQKEKIYSIQATYSEQLEELQKQIDAIEAKRDAEISGLLTPDQQKALASAKAASKAKASKPKATDAKPKTEPK